MGLAPVQEWPRRKCIPSGGALVTEGYGFFRGEVNDNESVSSSFPRILDGLLLSICEHRIVIPYETREHSFPFWSSMTTDP